MKAARQLPCRNGGCGDPATDGEGTCADQVRRMIAEGDVIGKLRTFAGGG